MGFGKFLGCVVGGAAAIIAAPIVLPAAAAVAATAAGAAATVGAAAASTAVGGAVVGAATTVAGAAATVGAAAASTAVGGAVVGAATTVAGAAATAGAAAATAGVVAAETLGVAIAAETVGAIAAGTVGAGLTYSGITSVEGFSNMKEAEEKIEVAKRKYKNAKEKLEEKQQKALDKLQDLNKLKLNIYSNEIKETIKIIKRIKNVKETEVTTSDIEFMFKPETIKEMEATAMEADNILKSSKDGLGMAATMSSLTTGLVSNFGVASTGTAISSLSGAAAKKAALAALGGGAKSIGGAGIAGGQVMLGGISLLPTAIILSHNYAKHAEEKLTEAVDYYSDVKKEIAKIDNVISWINNQLDPRINEIQETLSKMRTFYANNFLSNLRQVELWKSGMDGKIDFKDCSKQEKDCIVASAKIISELKEIIKAPLLDENGVIKESTIGLINYFKTNRNYA